MAQQLAQQLQAALAPVALGPLYANPGNNNAVVYDTLFGQVSIAAPANAGAGNLVTFATDEPSQNYIRRELGITAKVQKNNRMINALTNPRQYLVDKNTDLLRMADLSAGRFRVTYLTSIQRGQKDSDAQSLALKEAKELYNAEMVLHRENFPKDVTKKLIEKVAN